MAKKKSIGYEIALRRIEKARKTGATELNLNGLGLRKIPREIGKLPRLSELNLENNQLKELPLEIENLTSLTTLNIKRNELKEISSGIGNLSALTILSLRDNHLTSLPPEIGQLTKLIKLNFHGNRLSTLPQEFTQLSTLKNLSFGANQLTALPIEIAQLTSLTTLFLGANRLAKLPVEISNLSNLTGLDLGYNRFTKLPLAICKLPRLSELYFGYNRLRMLPREIGELSCLTKLFLDNNQIFVLPTQISGLSSLIILDLQYNHLTGLPIGIGKLTNLETLNIAFNRLIELPKKIEQLGKLKRISLQGNPLEQPPLEIAEKGIEAIREYFKALGKEKQVPLNEVKVLLVGEGEAGKTCLVNQLLNQGYNPQEAQTEGIKIDNWLITEDGKDIRVHLWDFGGQEIMRATHQFFLSKRSLYVLVLDGRKKDEQIEYWLKLIETFGGNSPILVVLNKMDTNPGFDVNRKDLKRKYPGTKGFFPLSCASGTGVKPFERALKKELAKMELIGTTWPKSWFTVKTQLETMKEEKNPFISLKDYTKMCEHQGISELSTQDTLVDFLHDLGIAVHFRDLELLDTHVLEPTWVTEGVYKIINSKQLAEGEGVLRLDLLREILKKRDGDAFEYETDKYCYLIKLMKKFELCYGIGENTILVPDLLKVPEPRFSFEYATALKFRLDYDFLPRSVMPRFIVKLHQQIKKDLQWRTGVVLKHDQFDASAVVKADKEAKTISIWVHGKQRRDFFAAILFHLREINLSFEKLIVVERVPLPDNAKVAVPYSHLLLLEQRGTENFLPEGSPKEYSVSKLLGSIQKPSTDKEMMDLLLKIVDKLDTVDTLEKKAEILILQPTVAGVGINLRSLCTRTIEIVKEEGEKYRLFKICPHCKQEMRAYRAGKHKCPQCGRFVEISAADQS